MTTYTVMNQSGATVDSGLSLEDAAIEALSYDGYVWHIVQDDDGAWTLLYSESSQNSGHGPGRLHPIAYSFAETEDGAREELFSHVRDHADDFHGWRIMTDAAFEADYA